MSEDCLFCRIASGESASEFVHQDEKCVAFYDVNPQAPVHILIIPRKHIGSLEEASSGDADLLGDLLIAAAQIARDKGFSGKGYRIVVNTNEDGGQTVFHLHIHLLGGRKFIFPPG